MPASIDATTARVVLPLEMLSARIGKGTVRSEIDRSLRFRIDGEPAASKSIVADSQAAIDLVATGRAQPLLDGLKSLVETTDAYRGRSNLKSITLLPDEHAAKGVLVLNGYQTASSSVEENLNPGPEQRAWADKWKADLDPNDRVAFLRRINGQRVANAWTKDEASHVAFSAATTYDGHIVVMPDVSREWLATLGMYRIQPGDGTTKMQPQYRADHAGRKAWRDVVHEIHHTVTPRLEGDSLASQALEEAISEVLAPIDAANAIKRSGADSALAALPARRVADSPVTWGPWSREHLPKPAQQFEVTSEIFYDDAPSLLRNLLQLAQVDRRTTAGRDITRDLLQARPSRYVARRMANELGRVHQLNEEQVDQVTSLIRRAAVGKASFDEIERYVTGAEGSMEPV